MRGRCFNLSLGAHYDTSATSHVGFAHTAHTIYITACREVGSFDVSHQIFDVDIIIVDICDAGIYHFGQIMGRVILSRRYVRLGQQFIPVNAAMLDLRGAGLTDLTPLDRCTALTELDVRENKLSAEALDEFRAKHPGCRVLYSVYLTDEPHESGTESLTLEDLPNDWENLRLFENLRSLTVNHCTQPDAMETLRAELPDCEMRYSL